MEFLRKSSSHFQIKKAAGELLTAIMKNLIKYLFQNIVVFLLIEQDFKCAFKFRVVL